MGVADYRDHTGIMSKAFRRAVLLYFAPGTGTSEFRYSSTLV